VDVESIKSVFPTASRQARVLMIVGISVVFLAAATAAWWVLSSRDSLLFGNLREADAAEISAALDEWKVQHSFTPDGAGILVDESQLHAVRMRLVSAGIPKGGHVGYELFDDNEFGVTEFAQRINYQRALQGELERTISTIPGVQSVRVHLNIRRPGLFLSDHADSKASVALGLSPGTSLGRKQVLGIRNLVASAVDGLKPEAVVIVGPGGLQLGGAPGAEEQGLATEHTDAARQLEVELETKVDQLLAEALHGQRASVSVNVRLNFDKVRTTSERVLAQPGQEQGLIIRRTGSGTRPPEGGGQATLLNEQVEYAHGMEREEITRAQGTVERISVAVMLPGSLSSFEQERLRRLVAAAVGLDANRGDTLEIELAPARESPRTGSSAIPTAISNGSANEIPSIPEAGQATTRLYPWLGAAWMLGLSMGLLITGFRRRRQPRLLTVEESEAAVLKARAWITGTVP
jgi:flagellar M-ring protein FliF